MGVIEILLYLCMFGLLIMAVIQDIRTRNIQLWVSIPFGLIAIILLVIQREYYIAGFLFLTLYMPRNWLGQLILLVASLFLIILLGLEVILPVIIGILFVDMMGRLGLYGLGDLALLFPLICLSQNWIFIYWICGLIFLNAFYLNLKRFNTKETLHRMGAVLKKIVRGKELDDEQTIKTPAAVSIGIATLGYYLIFPGIFLKYIIHLF